MKRSMPFFDRFWWLRSLWLVVLTAVWIGLLWLIVGGIPQRGGLSIGTALLLIAISAVTGALLTLTWWLMRQARHRRRARLAAIAGNRDAIPLARFAVEASDAPDIVAAPLVIEYSPSRWRTPFWSRLRVAAGILGMPYLVGMLALYSLWRPELSDGLRYLFALIWLLGVPPLSELRRSCVLAYRSGRRLRASLEGIEWVPVLGRTRFLRWDEARLLEVSTYADGTTRKGSRVERRRYTLYGTTTTLWWNDLGETYDKPSGDGARLLALIRARTGLVPRSFDDELRADTLLMRRIMRPVPPRPPVPVPQVVAVAAPQLSHLPQLPVEPEQVYTLATYVTTNRARAIAGAIGALLSLGGAAAVAWMLRLIQLARATQADNGPSTWLYAGWAALLGIAVLLGCLLVVAAVRKRGRMTIQADAQGLRMTRPGSSVLLRWNDVATITYTSARHQTMYVVHAWGAVARVVWPARVPPNMRAAAEPGTVAVTPDELAAIVAEQSGKPVKVRPLW